MAETNNTEPTSEQNSLTLSLSMVAGLGVVLMMTAAGLGVIQGAEADSTQISLLFLGGIALFIAGIGGWMGVVRPWENFDDINEPMYHGHEDHHNEDDHADETETPALPQTTAH